MQYKNVAIPSPIHKTATLLAIQLDRTLGGQGGIVVELLTNWLQENRLEEMSEHADAPTVERNRRTADPG